MSLAGRGVDNTVGAAAASTQRPVEVGVVVVACRGNKVALAIHNLLLQDLTRSEFPATGESAVTSTLAITTCETNGGTLAADHLETFLV